MSPEMRAQLWVGLVILVAVLALAAGISVLAIFGDDGIAQYVFAALGGWTIAGFVLMVFRRLRRDKERK